MTSVILRRLTIFGTPIALGSLAAIHPMLPEDNLGVWNLIHTLQIPLVALLGISVILLLRGVRSTAAAAARLAIIPWVAFFAAFDGVAGLATGAIAGFAHAHPETSDAMAGVTSAMGDSLVLSTGLPLGATAFSLFVFGGAAFALQRIGVGWVASTALLIGGVTWTFVHPLIGAPAMAVFLAGAAVVELGSRDARRSPTAAATGPATA